MPAEDAVAAAPELDPEAPADRPVGLRHDLQVVHLGDALGPEDRLARVAEERAPAAEVADRAVEARLAALAAEVEHGLTANGVRVRFDEVRHRGGIGRPPRRVLEPERHVEALADVVVERHPREPRDDVAEQRVGEVRVVPGGRRRQHLLGLGQALEQLGLAREVQRLPDLAGRLALEPRRVRQHSPDRRRAVRRLGQVA